MDIIELKRDLSIELDYSKEHLYEAIGITEEQINSMLENEIKKDVFSLHPYFQMGIILTAVENSEDFFELLLQAGLGIYKDANIVNELSKEPFKFIEAIYKYSSDDLFITLLLEAKKRFS